MSYGRIAVFQAEWPLQSQLGNTVITLIEYGYQVDVFLYNIPTYYFNLVSTNQLKIYDFTNLTIWDGDVIADNLIEASLNVIANQFYKCLIGFERMGLIWAGKIHEKVGIPLIYYSLELFTIDSPYFSGTRFILSKELEKKYHSLVVATIVQDEERAKVLLADNLITETKLLLVPVSVLGEPNKNRSNFLRKNLSIDEQTKIILVFGEIWDISICNELVVEIQDFPKDWVFVMHHCGSPMFLKVIENLDKNKRVIASQQYIPQDQVKNLISSADVGLALYGKRSINEYLTGSASEKIALYLQSGLPVITFDYPSFKNIIEKYRCGLLISDIHQLKKALHTIFCSLEEFQNFAFNCFTEHYQFDKQFNKVIQFIENLN